MMAKTQTEHAPVSDVGLALKAYGMTVVAAIMGLIVYISFTLLFNGLGTKSIGYNLYEKNEDGSLTLLETYYYQEGEGPTPDIELEENQTYVIFRSPLEGGKLLAFRVLTQLVMAILLWLFPFNLLRDRGEKDRTLVVAGCREPDTKRGLRVGLMTILPSLVMYAVWVIAQAVSEPSSTLFFAFRVANLAFDPLILWMMPDATRVSWWGEIVCLLLILTVPACTHLAYTMGYRNVHPIQSVIYPNKKAKR